MAEASGAGRVQVFARVRPATGNEDGFSAAVAPNDDAKTLRVRNDCDAVERLLCGQAEQAPPEAKEYSFDGVFAEDATQRDVFMQVGLPVLRECLKGINGTILAYGQTGSGKTHSLLHQSQKGEEAGLLPRLVASLFLQIAQDVAHVYDIEAASVQVYNEQVDDILNPDHESGGGQNLSVRDGGVVQGVTWLKCKRPDEMLDAFTRARSNVVYAETKMNKASSRSHAVFQIKIAKRKRVLEAATAGQKFECTLARLNVVDLAGSERVKKSGVEGMQFKEATNINKSLLAFGNVVSALAAKKAHIPLRDSKLTRILDGSIGGNCRTALLVCASPASENVHETLSTFEFASRAMRVEVDAKVNTAIVEFSAKALLADLSSDVGDLGGLKLGPELEALRKSAKEAAEKARKHAHEGEKAIQEAQSQAKKLQAEAEAAEMRGRQWQDQLASLRHGQELASSEADELRQAVKLASAEASEATAMLSEATAKAAAKAKEAAEATAKAEKFRAAAEKAENEALEWKAAALAREAEVKQVRVVQAKRDTAEIIKKKEEVVQAKQEASQKITEFKKEASEATVKAEARAELAEKAAASQGERASAAEAAMEAEREEAQKKLLAAEQLSEEALRVAAAEADSLRAQKEQAAAQSTAFEVELQSRTEELREKTKLLDEARIALEHLRREADDRETRLRLQFLAEIKELQQKHLAEVQALHFQITEAKSECERIQKESQSSMEEERQRHTAQAEALETMMRQKAGLAASDAAQLAAQHVAAAAQFAADFEARLSAGKESFEARLSELERSAQEQRRELLQELDEAKAEVTRTDERWKEVKEEAVREALEGGNAQQRRLSAAFKAARCIGSMKESELSKAVDELAERFAARESRPEDVQSLTLQQKKLQEQQKYLLEKEREKQHLSLELENRDANDRIFGGAERRRSKCPAGMGVPVLGKKLGEEQRYADRADKRRTSMERSSTPKSNSGRGLFTRSDAFVSVR